VQRILALRTQVRSYRDNANALDREGHVPRRATRWSFMTVRNVVQRAEATRSTGNVT
jgi:hypothetical protein